MSPGSRLVHQVEDIGFLKGKSALFGGCYLSKAPGVRKQGEEAAAISPPHHHHFSSCTAWLLLRVTHPSSFAIPVTSVASLLLPPF